MEAGQGAIDVVRRIQDLTSQQFLDMSADAPSFDVPDGMDHDSQIGFLNVTERRLYFSGSDGAEQYVESPELKRLDQRRHGEQCLVTLGEADERGRRIYFLARIER